MSATVFCTFLQKDTADFAVGRLTREVTGIQCVKPVRLRGKTAPPTGPGVTLSAWGTGESWVVNSVSGTGERDALPVTIKVICEGPSRNRVVSLLRSMGGRVPGGD